MNRRDFLAGSLAAPAAAAPTLQQKASSSPKDSGLRYATLGRTGLKVTRLVYGSATGNDPAVITRAIDMGINAVDTSRDYQGGNNERLVGIGIKGRRNEIMLSSKTIDVDLPGQPPAPRESVADAMKELETSLKELQTDHLDIWHLHHKNRPDQITDELLEAARLAKQQGKIRFVGVSTHRVDVVEKRILEARLDAVLCSYNFTMGPEIAASIERLNKAGLGILILKSTAGGKRGKDPRMKADGGMQAAYKWVLKNPYVHAVESNIESYDQLEENFPVMAEKYSEADAKLLAARFERIESVQCRMCGHCEGTCAKGLPVEHILRCVMYVEGYSQFGMGRDQYHRLSEEQRAQACSDCAECTVKCRFGLQVANQVRRAQEWFA